MNIFKNIFSQSGLTKLGKLGSITILISSLAACASSGGWLKQKNSALPLEAAPANSGEVVSFRAFETDERLYVAGSAKPFRFRTGTHVDVQLLDRQGQVIAERRDDIVPAHPRTAHGRGGRYSYVASFPLDVARNAAKVRIVCHAEHHS